MRFARFVPNVVPTPKKHDPAPAHAAASTLPRADRFVRAPLAPAARPPALTAMCRDCPTATARSAAAAQPRSFLDDVASAARSLVDGVRSFFARLF